VKVQSLALVSREFKGLAEAGGVKDVAFGLAKAYNAFIPEVRVVLPFYGFLKDRFPDLIPSFVLEDNNQWGLPKVEYYCTKYLGIDFCLLSSACFDKMSVYTYHPLEAHLGEEGKGYGDTALMNGVLSLGFLVYTHIMEKTFDVIHGQDSHLGFLPLLAKNHHQFARSYKDCLFLTTIHNAGPGYHFWVSEEEWKSCFDPQGELFSFFHQAQGNGFYASALFGHLNTVSPQYAREILDRPDDFSQGLGKFLKEHQKKLLGFYNGMPELGDRQKRKNSHILPFFRTEKAYKRHKKILLNMYLQTMGNNSLDLKVPLFAFQGRMVYQKGPDLLALAIEEFRENGGKGEFLIQGQGNPQFMDQFKDLQRRGLVHYVPDYDSKLGELLFKGCDYFIIPSRFEPCGLTDLKSIISGAVPLVHKVGGLAKIEDGLYGFVYPSPGCKDLTALLLRASHFFIHHRLELSVIQQRALRWVYGTFTWEQRVQEDYLSFFENALGQLRK